MKLKALLLWGACMFFINISSFAQENYWESIRESEIPQNGDRQIVPEKYLSYSADIGKISAILDQAPLRFSKEATDSKVILELPTPDGEIKRFNILNAPVFAPELAAKYPQIRSFAGQGVDDPHAYIRFDLGPKGFHAMILSPNHSTIFIDPFHDKTANEYIVYYKKDFIAHNKTMTCDYEAVNKHLLHDTPDLDKAPINGDCQFRDYRMALACTGEYAQFHGGTVTLVLAAMNTSMTRVNGVYENEISVTMTLVPNNDQLIFLNAGSDPYTNNNGGAMLSQNITTCNNIIGSANYDIGHVFSTGGGGVAYLQSVCQSNKAGGVTGQGTPVGDPFDIDYVCHEVGHQFGGRHTQNNSCNRDSNSCYEPGSASTIMGYAGICAPNVQSNSDDYFHINSIILMSNFITGSGNCSANTITGNNAPVADAGSNFTIPKSTPFILEGAATDADSDPITYCWEQYDKQVATMPPSASSTSGPAFRSLDPTTSPDRYMPSLDNVVNNTNNTWEVLANVTRNYNFRLTARDNNSSGGCTDDDNMTVSVNASSGPFLVLSPNTNVSWPGNSTQTVTWDVANTTASPVSCSSVDIFLSYDGGFTYPITLATNTSNDGSHAVTIPGTQSTTARIMVRGHNNIFYDISDTDFTISVPVAGFALNATPSSTTICSGTNANYTIITTPLGGFNNPITFSASGLPAGLIASFSPNPVGPGSNSNLSILNTAAAPAGTYDFDVIGTSGSITFNLTLELIVEAGILSPGVPDIPNNGATDISLSPELFWNPIPDAINYQVDVASDPAFGNIIESQANITTLSYTLSTVLNQFTTYYWRVRGTNNCTTGSFGAVYNFTTGNTLCTTFTSTDVPVTIPSSGANTVSSDVVISNTGTITDVNVKGIDISHTWVNDLIVTLESPSGTEVTLFDQLCGSQNNVLISFDDESSNAHGSIPCPPVDGLIYQPDGSLADFDTENGDGTWTLFVEDVENQDGGTINAWDVQVCFEILQPITATITGIDVNCAGGSDGVAFVVPAGGTGSYTYLWSNGQTGSSIANLTEGTYSCTISDGSNSITLSVDIDEPPALNVTETITNVVAGMDGAIDLLVNGGTNPFNYLWSNGATTEDIANLDAGIYTVTITDDNACVSILAYEVLLPPAPIVIISSDISFGCAPLDVQFTDQSSNNPTSWSWTFENGTPATSSQQNPLVNYSGSGLFNVTLTASNPGGTDTQTFSDYIEVIPAATPNFTTIINELVVDFTNTSQNADSYSWDFGDGNTSTLENPTHTYGQSGNYTVILTATNSCGSITVSQNVTVLIPPVAGFSPNPSQGCEPLTVQFVSTSIGQVDTYLWTFEGGIPASSTTASPVVIFNNPGIYDVSLEVTNAAGTDQVIQTDIIEVLPEPISDFSSTTTDLTVSFTNLSLNADIYSWVFGDGNTSTQENPVHTYAQSGNYSVTLVAINNCGTVSITQDISILVPPVAGFQYTPGQGCEPLTVQFVNTSVGQVDSYLWTFEGGSPASSTAADPVVVFENPGLYDVTLEVTNAAGTNQIIQTDVIEVFALPVSNFSSVVTDLVVNFTNLSENSTTYNWDFGDGNTSTQENPTHTYAQSGNYSVTLTASGLCGTVVFTQDISILVAPVAGFQYTPGQGCEPLTVQFVNTSVGQVDSYLWTFEGGDPASSTAADPVVVFENPGLYDVTLEVTNAAGTDQIIQTDVIEVFALPVSNFFSVVTDLEVNFTNLSLNATTYEWDFGDGNTSTQENPIYTYAESGNYSVTLTASGICGSVVFTQDISILVAPVAGFQYTPGQGCEPLTVQFVNTSVGQVDNYLWTFEGGDPATSTAADPVVVFENPGLYDVTLEVTNAAGTDQIIQTDVIEVFALPVSNFASVVTDLEVNFTNLSENSTTYNWDFGDGNTSTQENPTHTYAESGNYTVTLTASNNCGSITMTQEVSILTAPIAGFEFTPGQGCIPLTIAFTSTAVGQVDNYLWTFEGGDPATSAEANPIVIFNNPGTYSATLEVSNASGTDLISQSQIIEALPLPIPSFTTSIDGLVLSIINSSQYADTYSWNFGDGNTSNEADPIHSYEEDGNYIVSLTVENGCASFTINQNISISSAPEAGFTAEPNQGCAPLSVQYTSTSQGQINDYEWTFEGGTPSVSNEANPLVVYTEPGLYSTSLTVTNTAGSDLLESINGIEVLPGIEENPFTYVVNGNTVSFTNNALNGSDFFWNFGDANSSSEENPVHTYLAAGIYQVELTISNACETSTIIQDIQFGVELPVANFDFSATDNCVPATINFTDLSTGNPVEWQWSFEGGNPSTSSEQNPTIVYNEIGLFDVQLLVTNAAGTASLVSNNLIEIEELPIADFDYADQGNNTFQFYDLSQFGDSYEWDFGDGNNSTEASPLHTYAEAGSYIVVLSVSNDCGTTVFTQEILFNSVSLQAVSDYILIYPNPNTGVFTIDWSDSKETITNIKIYNTLGQTIGEYSTKTTTQIQIDLDHSASGIYYAELQSEKGILLKRVVKQ
jgi:PKD repeat protein/subtilisin-like proprotein convertase family protein